MKKNHTDRLSKQHVKSKGPEGIFGTSAQQHDSLVKDVSKQIFESLKNEFPSLEFRYREQIEKSEINKKLNDVDNRLGVTLFVSKSSIKPDGGVIEVKDKKAVGGLSLCQKQSTKGKILKISAKVS